MQTLVILISGLIFFIALVVAKRRIARGRAERRTSSDAAEDTSLGAQLLDAERTFAAAADSLSPGRRMLKVALTDLARQCRALAERDADGAGLPVRARAATVRLLLALYRVVERVTALARRDGSSEMDALLDSAVGAIVGAKDALHTIADQADETALRHLEADLDVLRARLDRSD